MNLLKLEFKLLFKNRAFWGLMATYCLLLLIAINFGTQRYKNEYRSIETIAQHFEQDRALWKNKSESMGPGNTAYYLFSQTVFTPSPWSALFYGERGEQLGQKRVRLLAVHGQIYGNPIVNHTHLALGRLDASFVWLYLMPVIIGLICVTLVADDKRSGRWPLLISVASNRIMLVIRRLAVRFIVLLLINVIALIIASHLLSLTWDSTFYSVASILLIYQFTWFLFAGLIVFLQKNAVQSILYFLSLWLISVSLIPGLHYLYKIESDSLNTGIELLVNQRQIMNDSWDGDKKSDFNAFLQRNPQWQKTTPLGEEFDWKWYYAMQKTSDERVTALAEEYRRQREATNSIWLWLSPTLIAQQELERTAHSDSFTYQSYLSQLIEWHQQLQQFWYPHFFHDKNFDSKMLNVLPDFQFKSTNTVSSTTFYYFIFIVCLLIAMIIRICTRNKWDLATGSASL